MCGEAESVLWYIAGAILALLSFSVWSAASATDADISPVALLSAKIASGVFGGLGGLIIVIAWLLATP